ncbi:MAG: hypothetical protein AAFW70_04080 [Cyanobacteria bacterium J06635_10]
MKVKSEYSPTEIYKLQKIKHVIKDIQKQLLEIDQDLKKIKENYPDSEIEQAKIHSLQFSDENNSKAE